MKPRKSSVDWRGHYKTARELLSSRLPFHDLRLDNSRSEVKREFPGDKGRILPAQIFIFRTFRTIKCCYAQDLEESAGLTAYCSLKVNNANSTSVVGVAIDRKSSLDCHRSQSSTRIAKTDRLGQRLCQGDRCQD